jgi:hypothetical protein
LTRLRLSLALLSLFFAGQAAADADLALSKGQTIYLPIYSHVYHGSYDRKGVADKLLLSAMISVRNRDPKRAIRITSARYFDTSGKLVREFVAQPKTLPPYGTLELFIERHDDSGGSGANFAVVWDAEAAANPPAVEAVHGALEGGRSVMFTTAGSPIRTDN